jgi:hypothetical protein
LAVDRAAGLAADFAAGLIAGFVAARGLVAAVDTRFAARAGALFLLAALLALVEAPPRAGRCACDFALLFAAVDDLVLVGIIPPAVQENRGLYIGTQDGPQAPLKAA